MALHWLFLHFPDLALEQLTRYQDAPNTPQVLIDAQSDWVMRCNHAARARGVAPGMGLRTANALAPELVIREEDPELTAAGLQQLAAMVYRHVAHIALKPPTGLLLEVASMQRLSPSLADLQTHLIALCQEAGYKVQSSQGQTPLMATLLAQSAPQPAQVSTETLQQALQSLPTTCLGLEPAHTQALLRLGIRTCGELLALPATGLGRRFGTQSQAWRARLLGEEADPQTWYVPARQFLRRIDFNEDIAHVNGLLFPLRTVFQELARFCREAQQATDEIDIRLRHRERPPTQVRLGSAQPLLSADAWSELWRLQLNRLTLFEPVIALQVRARRLVPVSEEDKATLWDAHASAPVDNARLLDRLQARLGSTAVHRLSAQADYRPERRNREVPLPQQPPARWPSPQLQGRPLWYLHPPQKVNRQQLVLCSGPERLHTGWWDMRGVKRDYFQARLANFSRCWVFRNAANQWFIAGYYG
ncbi:MAG: DNA polymerase Y family protein [Natronospirillum sp.]